MLYYDVILRYYIMMLYFDIMRNVIKNAMF